MSTSLLVVILAIAAGVGLAGVMAGHWAARRALEARLAGLEQALRAAARHRPAFPAGRGDTQPATEAARERDDAWPRGRAPRRVSGRPGVLTRWRGRLRRRERPALVVPTVPRHPDDPAGASVAAAPGRPRRATIPIGGKLLARSEPVLGRASGPVMALRPGPGRHGTLALRSGPGRDDPVTAKLTIHPGNGEPSRRTLPGRRSSWRVGAAPGSDIVIPDASVGVMIGRNRDVWTAASEGPIQDDVTLDAVTLPTVPMPWPPGRKLRIGAITMTLEDIDGPAATLEDVSNQTHANLAGKYAAHANNYALALARSGRERAESVTAAALACFDSRLLDPARGAALAAMNMTLARRVHESPVPDRSPAELFVGIAGFDRTGRLRAAANFPMAVWAVTDTGSLLLGQIEPSDEQSLVEVLTIPIDDGGLDGVDRPLLLVAAGPDLSVVGPRIRNLSTLNATAQQLTTAVLGPEDTHAPVAAAAAARANVG